MRVRGRLGLKFGLKFNPSPSPSPSPNPYLFPVGTAAVGHSRAQLYPIPMEGGEPASAVTRKALGSADARTPNKYLNLMGGGPAFEG